MKIITHKNSILVCALLGVMGAATAPGATIRYQGSGDYFDFLAAGNVGANGWQNVAGVPGLPGAADTARFNWANNTVTLAGAATTITAFQMGVDESGGLVVNNGGSLASTGNSTVGNNAGASGANLTTGFLTINSGGTVTAGGTLKLGAGASAAAGNLTGHVTLNGGTLNVSSHLWVGNNNLTLGIIDINDGGILNIGGMLGLGTGNATAASGGVGFLNVNDGGVLNLANIHSAAQGSIQAGSLLDISGSGLVTIPGNFVSVLNGYIAAGRITGNDVVGNAVAVFDSDLNKTFLTASPVPEPSTFALMAVAGLGLAFGLKRRS
ncbi:MAG: PEP-CTERM sorting domain-containing protein [Verrucomicrobiota bacterium]